MAHADSAGLLEKVGSTYLRPQNGMPGAGGKQLLIFRAVRAGNTNVTLGYVRPFDQSTNKGAKEMTFHVVVSTENPGR